jgi:hypothetical protein
MYHSKMLAVLDSEPALNATTKRYSRGGIDEHLTDTEQATPSVMAQAQIAEWEAEYR